ncbi:TraR/DksA C4-type zinc finger protein [candidate division WOR-3 bacterium]|nr:TraR/DksA C4-type zinc finger protein [candidate division WOR-3 bacterium]
MTTRKKTTARKAPKRPARKTLKKPAPTGRKSPVPAPRSKAKTRKLTRAQLVAYERALLAEKARLLRQREFTEEVMESSGPEGSGDLSSHRTHTADQGTENYQREMAGRFRTMEDETLRAIEEALRRVADGTYGVCEKCGAPIPKARLEIVPHARFCMKCLRAR